MGESENIFTNFETRRRTHCLALIHLVPEIQIERPGFKRYIERSADFADVSSETEMEILRKDAFHRYVLWGKDPKKDTHCIESVKALTDVHEK